MQKDSHGLTGEKIMQDENFKRAAIILTESEDVIKAWETLVDIMGNGTNAERIQAAKLILEYGKQKPPVRKDITTAGEKLSSGIVIAWEDDDEDIQAT